MNRVETMIAALTAGTPLRSPEWPHQKCENAYCPGLTSKPIHDPYQFEWARSLEEATPVIRRELEALVAERNAQTNESLRGRSEGEWGLFYLSTMSVPVERNVARCPETWRIMSQISGLAGSVGFAALAPDTHALPHYGTTNLKLRMHLGLIVPEGCGMRIGLEMYGWKEGKLISIDDTYQHEVWNKGKATRYILLFDVLHPDLTPDEQALVRAFEAQNSLDAIKATRGDDTGYRTYIKERG